MTQDHFMRAFQTYMMSRQDGEPESPPPLPEAIVDELRLICAEYRKPCPFKPGDLVTPRAGRNLEGVGMPHIVLEIIDPPVRWREANSGHPSAWGRLDLRLACLHEGQYVAFIGESWMYEEWSPA